MPTQASNNPPPSFPGPFRGRYVILRHERPQDTHWDLLLELPGQPALLTFQIHTPPDDWPHTPAFPATRLPDHRQLYLTYEGPISHNRGHVTRVAAGVHTLAGPLPAGPLLISLPPLTLRATPTGPDTWQFTPTNPA